ncbi:MAG: hypothetical protein H6741_13850 [Alphaproteobacteria bacterium]|nr:hypothetical protein [Alphaproteobacteria bacterium]
MKQHKPRPQDAQAAQDPGMMASMDPDMMELLGNQAMLGLSQGPFAPELEGLLESAFGPEVADLQLARGEDAQNEAIGANAHVEGDRISLSSGVREDPQDTEAMAILGEEVSHALAGGGSGETELDQAGDPGEAKATKAGEAFARFAKTGEASADLQPATGGRARVHRNKTGKEGAAEAPKTFPELLKALEGAKDDKARQAAALALAAWCRQNLPDLKTLEAYIANPAAKADEKTATLGQLQAALARNEFLLGNAFQGGVDKGAWETSANKVAFVDEYLNQVKLMGQVSREDSAWCTSFVGTQVQRAGFDFNTKTGKSAGSRSIFWSGSRLESWGKTGKNNSKKELNADGDRVADEGTSGKLIDASKWKALNKTVTAAKTDKDKKAAVDAFFKDNPMPQAGDIVVIGKNNAYKGKGNSHTMMVERYDSAKHVMSMVEGNSSDRVKGRTMSLTESSDLSQIIYSMRLGVEQYDDAGNEKTGKGPAPVTDPALAQVKAADVLKPVNDANSALSKLSVDMKWVKSTDVNATVSEMVSGKKVNSDDGSSATR